MRHYCAIYRSMSTLKVFVTRSKIVAVINRTDLATVEFNTAQIINPLNSVTTRPFMDSYNILTSETNSGLTVILCFYFTHTYCVRG